MKCIVTSKETNVIKRIGILKERWPNGYPVVSNADGDTAYPTTFTALYEIDDIPAEVEVGKYCYTPELGFYENPNYVEPDPYGIPKELVERIKNDAIAEVEEAVVNADE